MFKEGKSLLKARTKSLINAENLVQELSKENLVLYNEKKEIAQENTQLKAVIYTIKILSESNKYNNEKMFINKIKELVNDYPSIN
jgi:hypothetical protein